MLPGKQQGGMVLDKQFFCALPMLMRTQTIAVKVVTRHIPDTLFLISFSLCSFPRISITFGASLTARKQGFPSQHRQRDQVAMEKEPAMTASVQKQHNLFQVYLRLRPSQGGATGERFLNVEEPDAEGHPKHITLNPPNDRRRAIEKFAFTQVFEEHATQLDVFHCTGVVDLVKGVLAPCGGDGTDALLATLGVTGSGKVGLPIREAEHLLTGRLQDSYYPGVPVPTRPDAARPRCHLSVAGPEPSQPRCQPDIGAINRRVRSFRGGHVCCIDVSRWRVHRPGTFPCELTSTYPKHCRATSISLQVSSLWARSRFGVGEPLARTREHPRRQSKRLGCASKPSSDS